MMEYAKIVSKLEMVVSRVRKAIEKEISCELFIDKSLNEKTLNFYFILPLDLRKHS